MAKRSYRGGGGGYRKSSSGYSARGRASYSRGWKASYRKSGSSKRRASPGREVRIVIEQVPASPVARPNVGLLNTMLRAAPKPPGKAKL